MNQIQKAGLGLDLVVGLRGELKEHPDTETRLMINRLWDQRLDTTGRTLQSDAKLVCTGPRSHLNFYNLSD
jgi:hypothetical protein